MCGITGSFRPDADPVVVAHSLDIIAHRGPDASDVWASSGIALGHARLAIIDLDTRSNQPLRKDGLVIAFNGEIYNYRELRRELGDERFVTTSDTEVVLEAWRQWGPGSLNRFRGMFAFALFDERSRRLVLARDHFGIKPLYYRPRTGGVDFASELKALTVLDRTPPIPNNEALVASMLWVWTPEELCPVEGTHKVQPGHYLTVDADGATKDDSYWSLLDEVAGTEPRLDLHDSVALVRRTLSDSVEHHLIADVPVSAFLSGGLDSSLLVAMAAGRTDSLEAFTIRFRDQDKAVERGVDDAAYARVVADHVGVPLTEVEVEPNVEELLPQIVWHLDEPTGDSAAINTFLITAAARERGCKVLLSGMGADEIFGGYRKHQANLLAARYRRMPETLRHGVTSALKRLDVKSERGGRKAVRWAKRFDSFSNLDDHEAFLRSYSYYGRDELVRGLSFDGAAMAKRLWALHAATYEAVRSRGHLRAMTYTDTVRFMTSLNLSYTDRASMASSTEVRVPFIDREVVSAAFDIPDKWKIRGRTQKYVLKRAAEPWLPKEVIYRPKASFTLPLRAWIAGDLAETVGDYLLASDGLVSRGLVTREFLTTLVQQEHAGSHDNAQRIWQLLVMEQWFREYIDKPAARDSRPQAHVTYGG